MEALILIILIIAGLIGLAALVLGAIALFAFAAEQGFVGLAAYVACWVFLVPIMASVCIITGLISLFLILREKLS